MQGVTQSWAYLTLGEETCLLWPRSTNSSASMLGCIPGMGLDCAVSFCQNNSGFSVFQQVCCPLIHMFDMLDDMLLQAAGAGKKDLR